MSATCKPVTLNCSCWRHIINILLTKLSRSVWENLDLGRVYRPHCVWSVLTTSVKILPHRPPARLIRAKSHRGVVASRLVHSSSDRVVAPHPGGSRNTPSCFMPQKLGCSLQHMIFIHKILLKTLCQITQ